MSRSSPEAFVPGTITGAYPRDILVRTTGLAGHIRLKR